MTAQHKHAYSISELARDRWACHHATVRKHIHSGELRALNIGSAEKPVYRIALPDIEEFEQRRGTRVTAARATRAKVKSFV